ncbi:hypothetical protein GF314_09160 [bacterium]|nr:hypothetical protein [bacterium]
MTPDATLTFDRDARVFVAGSDHARRLAAAATIVELAAGDTLAPGPSCDLVVRQGNLRVSERLTDGREITRAVLQTGMICRVRSAGGSRSDTVGSALYSLEVTELKALTDTEIWQLPAGACDPA